jgi:hypothetical protein
MEEEHPWQRIFIILPILIEGHWVFMETVERRLAYCGRSWVFQEDINLYDHRLIKKSKGLRIFYHAQLARFFRHLAETASNAAAYHLSKRSKAIIGELNDRQANRIIQ